jgi:putative oxidoreductase
MNTGRTQQIAFLVGRLLVGGMYLYSGVDNIVELPGKVGYAASKGLLDAPIMVTAASSLLILAGLSLVTGIRPKWGVAATAMFLIPVTLIMHNFWALQGLQRIAEMHNFQGNLGLLGSALIFLAVPEPWRYSLAQPAAALAAAVRRLLSPAKNQMAPAK